MSALDPRATDRGGQPGRPCRVWRRKGADVSVAPGVVPRRHVARHRDDRGHRPAAEQRSDDVDVRGRAAVQSAELRRDDPLRTPVAPDHDCRALRTSRRRPLRPRRSGRRAATRRRVAAAASSGSFGTAEATRIEASFDGADCDNTTFDGRVTLTKDGELMKARSSEPETVHSVRIAFDRDAGPCLPEVRI